MKKAISATALTAGLVAGCMVGLQEEPNKKEVNVPTAGAVVDVMSNEARQDAVDSAKAYRRKHTVFKQKLDTYIENGGIPGPHIDKAYENTQKEIDSANKRLRELGE